MLPSGADAATDRGVVNIAVTIPSSLVPLYGPSLLGIGHDDNCPALLLSGIVIAPAALPAVRMVRGVH